MQSTAPRLPSFTQHHCVAAPRRCSTARHAASGSARPVIASASSCRTTCRRTIHFMGVHYRHRVGDHTSQIPYDMTTHVVQARYVFPIVAPRSCPTLDAAGSRCSAAQHAASGSVRHVYFASAAPCIRTCFLLSQSLLSAALGRRAPSLALSVSMTTTSGQSRGAFSAARCTP